jgi:fructose-bisphosphate aldolase class II
MLTNPKNLIHQARDAGVAIPAFNIDSLEMAMGVISAAETKKVNILLQITVETLNIWGWDVFSDALLFILRQSDVNTGLILDHAKNVDDIKKAIDLGFSGVMFDGSALPLPENIALSLEAVSYAKTKNCYVEGEIGHVARDGEPPAWEHLTTVEEAWDYLSATRVDALAVAIGSKHGHYRNVSDIRMDRVQDIFATLGAPLVLHGGSGMPQKLFPILCSHGIAKVNIGTELRRVWWQAIENNRDRKPREAVQAARIAVQATVEHLITVIAMER